MKTDRENKSDVRLVQGCNDEDSVVQSETWLTPHRSLDIRRIVVPIDFSPSSRKSLQYAAATALEFGAEIWLVHAVQSYPLVAEIPVSMMDIDSERTKSAEQSLEEWSKTVGPVRAVCAVRVGDPAQQIMSFAKENHADLIVMATSGRTGLAHLVIGSVAEKVVRSAPCPVLIVRDAEQDFLKIDADDAVLNRVGVVCEHSATATTTS